MPEQVKQALASGLNSFSRYPDPQCRELRNALAGFHGIAVENILCGNGAADLIFRICAWKKPKRVLVPAPTFSEYERPVKLFGGTVEEYILREENGFELTEDFADAITEDTDMVFLCNPNNPTGRLIWAQVLDAILLRCRETGTLLVVDECFIEFTGGSSLLPKLKDNPDLLILRAFTKFYAMAGLRLGYLLGESALLREIEAYGAHWSVSGPAQTAGIAALQAEPMWTYDTRKLVADEQKFMSRQFSDRGIMAYPTDTCFMLLRSDSPLYEALKDKRILIRSCANFTGLDVRYVRIGLKTREQNQILLRALEEVLHG